MLGFQLKTSQSQVFRLGQVVSLLQMTAGELDEHLAEAGQDNPMLILRHRPARSFSTTDVVEATAIEQSNSLYEHVFHALAGLISQGGLMEKVILALISDLDPSGWLARSPHDIADALGVAPKLIETALRVVQKRIDPPGLFARDLKDCLRLQLEDRAMMTDQMACVLSRLSDLEHGGIAGLASATGLDAETVQDCLAIIRRLDPKPGSAFDRDQTILRAPDVRVTPDGNGWHIEFLSSLQQDIQIAELPRGEKTAEIQEALAKARALKHALETRHSALRQVIEAVVDRQGAFFRLGDAALDPMTMSDIAAQTGFHLSTVSRVLNGLLIEGPNGITAARRLFGGTASAQSTRSKPQVQARIRAVLAKEDPERPISDRHLTTILQSEGIVVSRRVVSNYRQEIGILGAAQRRPRA